MQFLKCRRLFTPSPSPVTIACSIPGADVRRPKEAIGESQCRHRPSLGGLGYGSKDYNKRGREFYSVPDTETVNFPTDLSGIPRVGVGIYSNTPTGFVNEPFAPQDFECLVYHLPAGRNEGCQICLS